MECLQTSHNNVSVKAPHIYFWLDKRTEIVFDIIIISHIFETEKLLEAFNNTCSEKGRRFVSLRCL